MGLDIFIYCNCYKNGKTKPFLYEVCNNENGFLGVIKTKNMTQEEYDKITNMFWK